MIQCQCYRFILLLSYFLLSIFYVYLFIFFLRPFCFAGAAERESRTTHYFYCSPRERATFVFNWLVLLAFWRMEYISTYAFGNESVIVNEAKLALILVRLAYWSHPNVQLQITRVANLQTPRLCLSLSAILSIFSSLFNDLLVFFLTFSQILCGYRRFFDSSTLS